MTSKSKFDDGIIFAACWLYGNHCPEEIIEDLLIHNDMQNADVSDYDGYGEEWIGELNKIKGIRFKGVRKCMNRCKA